MFVRLPVSGEEKVGEDPASFPDSRPIKMSTSRSCSVRDVPTTSAVVRQQVTCSTGVSRFDLSECPVSPSRAPFGPLQPGSAVAQTLHPSVLTSGEVPVGPLCLVKGLLKTRSTFCFRPDPTRSRSRTGRDDRVYLTVGLDFPRVP